MIACLTKLMVSAFPRGLSEEQLKEFVMEVFDNNIPNSEIERIIKMYQEISHD